MTGSPELRASDADRDRAVGQLREHSLAGRLTVEELDERSAAAFAAKTVGELDALLADLPRERAPATPARAPAPVQAESGGFGRRPFTYVFEHPVRPGKVMEHTLATMALAGGGYELVERDDARLVFDYTYRPGWVAIPCILIPFPGPGWAIVILGLAIWAIEFAWARNLLEFTKRHVQSWTHWIARQTIPVRALVGLVGMIFVSFIVWASVKLSFGIDLWQVVREWVT